MHIQGKPFSVPNSGRPTNTHVLSKALDCEANASNANTNCQAAGESGQRQQRSEDGAGVARSTVAAC